MGKEEKHFTQEMKCGHCQNSVFMEIVGSYSAIRSYADGPMSWESGYIYNILVCPACDKVSFRRYGWDDQMDPADVTFEVIYPQVRDLRGLPPKVDAAYKAAVRVRTVDANAYGVLIGRVLDLICEDRAATGRSLDSRLKSLAVRGEIPTKLVNVATGLRRLRNIGAHADLGELTEEDLPVVENLARAILEYVYTAPLLAEEAERRLALLTGGAPHESSS